MLSNCNLGVNPVLDYANDVDELHNQVDRETSKSINSHSFECFFRSIFIKY